jgi:hypothetical protein
MSQKTFGEHDPIVKYLRQIKSASNELVLRMLRWQRRVITSTYGRTNFIS